MSRSPEDRRGEAALPEPPARPEARNGMVTATALGSWPGTDPVESSRVVRGELGDPHLPFLVELPQRGPGADALGRSAALLVDLFVDVQPHGWRLVGRPGKDHRRAASLLTQDLNALADVVGAEERTGEALKISVRGPLSLAANLYLHNGERALSDAGARREILQSFTAGVGDYVARASSSAPGARITVQVDEPDIAAVLAGGIPTASGYRTLRSVPSSEVSGAWQQVREAIEAVGADTVFTLPRAEGFGPLRPGTRSPFELAVGAGAQGAALDAAGLDARDWEGIAEAVEGGRRIWLGILPVPADGAALPQVTDLVERVLRPWRKLGLPLQDLPALRLTPAAGLADISPEAARKVLARLTQTASALDQVVAEG
ncbi:hypothetical protein NNX28_05915 [Arthrobacter sp. zg-Y859]|uniref:Cobalamin-independent methionine synthase MetE C-terminal/archaeal domain-containing protein n=1 Tax=Arthrobacter jinronghuae TaxID=2964609 RepID=A0ABT1NP07_9MICC|nr:hypothetical protein [Arthrobacter jinronghuae]MCQ1949465.1 hypothetical protein [Arthrobacter jinronghuae]UWX77761.1 hypothetical protein N2K98_12345 [Arthrobacter jinronghuae]